MASNASRRRELERQRHERKEQRRAEAVADRHRTLRLVAILAVTAAVVGGLVVATGALGGEDDASTTEAAAGGETAACEYRETGDSAVEGLTPPTPLDTGTAEASTATITLNGAPVTAELLSADTPCTVHSFAHLAAADYFDGTTCHRLTSSGSLKVLQCGDPTGSGSGGPGYEFDNENTDGATYPAGTIAMANAGPDTNGSQFFLVYEDSELPPDYTVFGHITGGLDVIADIAAAGTADGGEDGAPASPVTVDDITTAA